MTCRREGNGGAEPKKVRADEAYGRPSAWAEIRQQHPYWLMSFSAADREYFLDIVPARGPKEAVVNAIPFSQRHALK